MKAIFNLNHFWKWVLPTNIIFIFVAFMGSFNTVATLIFLFLIQFSIEIGIHRLLAHKAFSTPEWIKNALILIGSLGGQGTAFFWAAVHRGVHHPYADQEKDPHTPTKGVLHSYFLWLLKENLTSAYRKAPDLLRDKFLMKLHNNQYVILYGFSILLIGLDSVFSTRFFGSYILAVIFSSHLNYLVNTVCHLKHFGYRSFETKDNSRNIWTLSFFTAGLSLHNNHHKDPGNPNFAKKWYEIDLSYLVICLLRKK